MTEKSLLSDRELFDMVKAEGYKATKKQVVEASKQFLSSNGFSGSSLEDNIRLMENSEFMFPEIVPRMMNLTRDELKENSGIFLYPGANLDFDHALLFPSKTYMMIDPIYKNFGINPVIDRLKRLGVKIEEVANSQAFNNEMPVDIIITHAGYERNIKLIADDAVKMLNQGTFPFTEQINYDMLFLKKPSRPKYGNANNLRDIASPENIDKLVKNIPKNKFLFEAGAPIQGLSNFKQLYEGLVECWTINASDNNSQYSTCRLYSKN